MRTYPSKAARRSSTKNASMFPTIRCAGMIRICICPHRRIHIAMCTHTFSGNTGMMTPGQRIARRDWRAQHIRICI